MFLKHRQLTRTARQLSATLGIVAGAAAQHRVPAIAGPITPAVAVESEASPNVPVRQIQGAAQIAALINQSGVLWYEAGNPSFLYWTYDFNEATGELVPMKQFAYGPLPSHNTGNGTTYYSFDLLTNQEAAYRSYCLSANAYYRGAFVRAVAESVVSSELTQGTFAGTTKLDCETEYPDALLNTVDFASLPLHPDAAYVLNLPIAQRAAAWRARGFGKYIAFGYALRSGVQLELNFSNRTRAEQRRAWGKLVANYGSVGASVEFETALRAALETGFVSLRATFTGVPGDQTTPSLQQLLDPVQLRQWLSTLVTNSAQAKVAKGLYLAPASSIAGGLDWALPTWSQVELSEAQTIANDSMKTLAQISVWNQPYSLRNFIDVRQMPGSTTSYGQELNARRAELVSAVQALGDAVLEYMAGNNSANSAVLAQLTAAKSVVIQKRAALDSMLVELDLMIDALPQPQIEVFENWTPLAGDPYAMNHRFIPAKFRVHNFAAFPISGSYVMEDVIRQGLDSKSAISVREYDWVNNWYGLRTYGGEQLLRFPTVTNDQILSAGLARGLHDFDVTFQFMVRESTQRLDGRVYDELGRSCELPIQLADDHSF